MESFQKAVWRTVNADSAAKAQRNTMNAAMKTARFLYQAPSSIIAMAAPASMNGPISGMYVYLSAAAWLPTCTRPITGRSVTMKKSHAAIAALVLLMAAMEIMKSAMTSRAEA